jgi:hypothetical protein
MIKFLTLRQFICPLRLFLKEIQFASLTNAIDVNDSFTHGKVCTQMGSGHPSVCTTSDFHAVLFWFVYDTSAVRRQIQFASLTNAIDVKIERVLTGFLIG